jgi:TrmH family RNA methyltransferase
MTTRRITSRDNPLIKTIRLVAMQSRKSPPDLVLAEGVRVLEEAAVSGHAIEFMLCSDDFGSSEREARLLEVLTGRGVRVVRAPLALLERISGVTSPQGAIAMVKIPERSLSDLPLQKAPLLVCADALQDPGNLGTLCRTARAAGAAGSIATIGTAAFRNPKTVRASAGSIFRLPWVENVDRQEFYRYCRDRGIPLYRSSTSGGRPYWEVDFRLGCALVLGNESQGVADSDWPGTDCLHIPMAGRVESLNVAAAGAVILFEAFKQRSTASDQGN